MKTISLCVIAAIVFLSFPLTVQSSRAEETDKLQAMPPVTEGSPAENEVSVYTKYMPYSPADSQPGKVGILQTGGEFSHEFKILEKLPLTVSLSSDYMNIDKTVELPLPVSLLDLAVDIEAKVPALCFDDMYLSLGVTPSFACDQYSVGADSFLMPARALLIYILNDQLVIAGGAQFFSDFDNSVLPIGGIVYKPDDRWTLNLTTDNPYISYGITKYLEVFAEGDYSIYDQYKVRKGGDDNVLLEYRDISLGGGLRLKPGRYMTASISLGGVFCRGFKYPDASGKVDIDKGYYLQGKGTVNF